MKYFLAALASLIMLVGGYIQIEWFVKIRQELHQENWSEKKGKLYKIILIIWVLATVTLFVCTFAGVAFRGL